MQVTQVSIKSAGIPMISSLTGRKIIWEKKMYYADTYIFDIHVYKLYRFDFFLCIIQRKKLYIR